MPSVVLGSLPEYERLDGLLCAVGLAGLLSVFVPLIATTLNLSLVRLLVEEIPSLAEPDDHDPDYAARHAELARLGFRSAGVTHECGYLLAIHWYCSFHPRHLISADGKTFATVSRLWPGGMPRLGFSTVVDGDRLVRTAMPGTGMEVRASDYHRTESPWQSVADLHTRHLETVNSFLVAHGGTVVTATLAELVAIDRRILPTELAAVRKWELWVFPAWAWMIPFLFVISVLYLWFDVTLLRRLETATLLATCAYWVLVGPFLHRLLASEERAEAYEGHGPAGN